ncbi:MAG: glycosyltransferase family 2 protein [Alphaproteobacteria bacterium]|nr:glycosyltransferase family 2 protein [Alphaproteobacteria bacterium]
MVKISVIIPCYNVAKYLEQCLDSVLKQTFQDFEVICVNDGSTDKSLEILQQYAEKDARIKIIDQENKGAGAARNKGLDVAQGEYISFVDSDDFIDKDFLQILFNNIEKAQTDISCCNFYKIKSDKDIHSKEQNKNSNKLYINSIEALITSNKISYSVWNKLYRASILKDIKFDENNFYEDWIFIALLFPKIKSVCSISNKLYGYRIRENSVMRSKFTINRAKSYVSGIEKVYFYYESEYPQYLNAIKHTRLLNTTKMLINKANKSNDTETIQYAKSSLSNFYKNKIIGYKGLSLKNKIKLWKFLH